MTARKENRRRQPAASTDSNTSIIPDFTTMSKQFQDAVDPTALECFANSLGVSAESLRKLGIGRDGNAWTFPELDNDGQVIGISRRPDHGKKHMVKGSKRGLTMLWPLDRYAGTSLDKPILVVEGASDAAAALDLGYDVIARPSATDGLKYLQKVLKDQHVVIVGEHDDSGAGRDGANKMADGLADICKSVRIIFPPEGVKDLRTWKPHMVDGELAAAISGASIHERTEPIACRAVTVCLADVQPEQIEWLWPYRIALGKLAILVGDPGLGKSFVTLDIASRVSTGVGWPDRPGKRINPGGVVLLSAEDGLADTIRPRLDEAGADVSRIVALQGVKTIDTETGAALEHPFCLTTDLPALENAIRQIIDCRLVVIDPITAYLGGTDSHKNAEVRGVLAPLSDLAARYGVAVVAVSHLNKSAGAPAIYRTMGSLAFTAAARAVWGVTKDKDDPQRRLLLPVKNNIAADTLGLAYSLRPEGATAVVAWEVEPVNMTADEAMASEHGDDERSDRDQAADWLRDALADGMLASRDVFAQAKENGITEKTLRRAFKDMGGKPFKSSFGGGWHWRLPGEDGQFIPEDSQDAHPKDKGILGESGHLGNTAADDWGEI